MYFCNSMTSSLKAVEADAKTKSRCYFKRHHFKDFFIQKAGFRLEVQLIQIFHFQTFGNGLNGLEHSFPNFWDRPNPPKTPFLFLGKESFAKLISNFLGT